MTDFDSTPPAEAIDEVRLRWHDDTDTFDRVYSVILGITDPTPYSDIAETADCSPNAAKKHLERLAEMGIVHADRDSRPARYERNDGYLEWREASRVAEELTLEADRPAEDAPEHEHDAYAHERAATMAAIASELLSAVAHSDVVTDVETGQLLVGRTATHELVSDHHHTAHWIRENARRER